MKHWKLLFATLLLTIFISGCGTSEPGSSDTEVSPTFAPVATDIPSTDTPDMQSTATPDAEDTQPNTLQSHFAQYNMKAGTCLSSYMTGNKACVKLIKEHFNSITLENDMKPDYILDQKASKKADDLVVNFNYNTCALLDWCQENNMAVRGHTLVWYSQTPNWIFYEDFNPNNALVSREIMLARMESYIRQTFEKLEELGYLDMFYAYDVVNEAWMEDGTKRDNLWLKTIGDDYMWYAFYYADKYAPETIDLYYNDYNEQYKTDTLYNFVQTLVDEDGRYLIDGIGLQAHLYTEDNLTDYLATVEKLGSLGLKINLTELDVCLGSWPEIKPATEENLKAQGQYYYNLINGLLQLQEEEKVEMDAITFWGFTDKLSWRGERNPALFNNMYQPKYAYYGAMQMKELAGFLLEAN
ncbi:MAG: endo-1,4-beta-xylanase [Lachnospiraceae bacterium]|nr:endo-1,4-beta-xylanase [Lachnospiraceae bacterium]